MAAVLATSPLCPTGTEDGQDREGAREELHGSAPEDDPPRRLVPSTLRWTPGRTWERHQPPGGQHRCWRCVGFELVLDPVVPQLGRELVEVPTVVSQPEFQQHSAEQNVDIPARGGVGHRGDRFVDPARGFTLTSEEQHSMVRLMPDYRRRTTASPGRYTNTGRRARTGNREILSRVSHGWR